MSNSKLPENWRPCDQDLPVKSVLNQSTYTVIEDQLDLSRDLSYLSGPGYELDYMSSGDNIYFALHAGTPIRKKKQGKLPQDWSGPPVHFRTYSKTKLSCFNEYKKTGVGLRVETLSFKKMSSDEVFLNKLYCGLLIKDKIK